MVVLCLHSSAFHALNDQLCVPQKKQIAPWHCAERFATHMQIINVCHSHADHQCLPLTYKPSVSGALGLTTVTLLRSISGRNCKTDHALLGS